MLPSIDIPVRKREEKNLWRMSIHCWLFGMAQHSITFEDAVTHWHVDDDHCSTCRRCVESARFNIMVIVEKQRHIIAKVCLRDCKTVIVKSWWFSFILMWCRLTGKAQALDTVKVVFTLNHLALIVLFVGFVLTYNLQYVLVTSRMLVKSRELKNVWKCVIFALCVQFPCRSHARVTCYLVSFALQLLFVCAEQIHIISFLFLTSQGWAKMEMLTWDLHLHLQ